MMWRKTLSYLFGAILCMIMAMGGCKKNAEAQVPPFGVLLEFDGCKQFQGSDSTRSKGITTAQNSDCLQYQYDGQGILQLKHINACFNCCPGEITADIAFNGNVITITEQEQQAGCHCLCLFDLDYKLQNLLPGEYTIRVIEPYIIENDNDQVLELTVSLSSAAAGSFCLDRNHYPWVL